MGEVLGRVFINPDVPQNGGVIPDDAGGFIQVLFLGLCYGFLLLKGSNLIADGSELLLLIPEAAGMVGSVVLPVLGAVPDGAIVLFSGLGPPEEVKTQLSVGVGALAGSTVMLITVPWFLSILGGRVPIVNGEPCYSRRGRLSLASGASGARGLAAAAGSLGCASAGVAPEGAIRVSAGVMLLTGMLGYLIVEVPALIFINESAESEAKDVGPYAWLGALLCAGMFAGYLALQLRLAKTGAAQGSMDYQAAEVAQRMIAQKELTLSGVLSFFTREASQASPDGRQPLSANAASLESRLAAVVRPFFTRYDADRNGALSREELAEMVADLGERVSGQEIGELFASIDADGSGSIDYQECVQWLARLVLSEVSRPPRPSILAGAARPSVVQALQQSQAAVPAFDTERPSPAAPGGTGNGDADEDGDGDDDDEEEPEVPEDIRDLPPKEQRRRVLRRACQQMGLGTLMVLVFSDPMVDVLNTLGGRTGIPAFYVSFLLAPVASNASEMIASYSYAQKKSQKTITIAFAQLLGAACMNNTLCLAIFYLLVASRGLGWTYHAEVAGIFAAEVAVAFMACRRVHRVWHGAVVLTFLPMCLLLVYVLKATVFSGKEV